MYAAAAAAALLALALAIASEEDLIGFNVDVVGSMASDNRMRMESEWVMFLLSESVKSICMCGASVRGSTE